MNVSELLINKSLQQVKCRKKGSLSFFDFSSPFFFFFFILRLNLCSSTLGVLSKKKNVCSITYSLLTSWLSPFLNWALTQPKLLFFCKCFVKSSRHTKKKNKKKHRNYHFAIFLLVTMLHNNRSKMFTEINN